MHLKITVVIKRICQHDPISSQLLFFCERIKKEKKNLIARRAIIISISQVQCVRLCWFLKFSRSITVRILSWFLMKLTLIGLSSTLHYFIFIVCFDFKNNSIIQRGSVLIFIYAIAKRKEKKIVRRRPDIFLIFEKSSFIRTKINEV